jgi:hypothetical protein
VTGGGASDEFFDLTGWGLLARKVAHFRADRGSLMTTNVLITKDGAVAGIHTATHPHSLALEGPADQQRTSLL